MRESSVPDREIRVKVFFAIFLAAMICLPVLAADTPTTLGIIPSKSDIANLAFANQPAGSYYFKFNQDGGGGINALHVSSNSADLPNYGDVSTTTYQSGTFYVTETGGRGYQDEAILLVAVMGEIPDNFAIHIKSSGYSWAPTGTKDTPPTLSQVTYHAGAVDQTFTKSQFVYGPQTWRPAGNNVPSDYPIYYGQDTTDSTRKFKLMFVDLKAGPLGPNAKVDRPDAIDVSTLTDYGAVKVEYRIENLDKVVSFNTYAWNDNTTQGKGISWSNGLTSGGSVPSAVSGYTVLGPEFADKASEFPSLGSSIPVFHGPQTNFSASVTSGPAPFSVQFSDTTAQSVSGWNWDFGDGGKSTEQNPVHVYTAAGTYTVSLSATNNQGISATKTLANLITVTTGSVGSGSGYSYTTGDGQSYQYNGASYGKPGQQVVYTPVFSANITGGVPPLAVQFWDNSSIPNRSAWSWDFTGDGLPDSTAQNPVFVFRHAGNYTVNLNVTTSDGGVFGIAMPDYIRIFDTPQLNSDEGWIFSDSPASPGAAFTQVQNSTATQQDNKSTSPVGTKIAGILLDAVVVVGIIGGGIFLWLKP
ncbi:MAG: PKD domain-containing protein [Methanoregula sp.]|nr:PKD domain-containing protein [Methanoregula sp.]